MARRGKLSREQLTAIHAKGQTKRGLIQDRRLDANITLPATHDNIDRWKKSYSKMDIQGVDTKMMGDVVIAPPTRDKSIDKIIKYGYAVKFLNRTNRRGLGNHDSEKKIITVYTKGRTEEQIVDTLNHEIGHILDHTRRGIVDSPIGASIKGYDGKMRAMRDSDLYFRYPIREQEAERIREMFPIRISSLTQAEIYAEAYKLKMRDPQRLKEIAPTIYEDIKNDPPPEVIVKREMPPHLAELVKTNMADNWIKLR